MKILVLEPYYGGSHKSFLQGLRRYLPMRFELLTLSARKWKWRMRLAAPYFAELMRNMEVPDRVLCSTFVDVAALRALAPPWIRQVELLTYYHENQFVYPVRVDDERDFHFALTNYTTALASDRLAFNSGYNLETFLAGAETLVKKAADMRGPAWEDFSGRIRGKSVILHPGLDFTDIDATPAGPCHPHPVIVWNHRWEHDKNPEDFFNVLYALDRQGIDFFLVMLGQSFARRPEIFAEAEQRLAHRILHWGYVKSREEYIRWLKHGNLVVSTARHEFYGIAVIEAVRAGCRPLLPDRLSYPELFPAGFLYRPGELPGQLADLLKKDSRMTPAQSSTLTGRFSWDLLAEKYRAWITGPP
ncbi:MAG: DUF3524 domain-containing protein [Desulfobacterales bacterium]|nr:DUF3524 domain-containing protein [Desulfobacterales bacterium]